MSIDKGETEGAQLVSAFCVAVLNDGSTVKVQDSLLSNFTSTLDTASLAWIDFTVSVLEKEGTAAATALGFSSSLVRTLLTNRYSGYEDLETELGLMLPAVRVEKLDVDIHPLLILIRKGLVVTLHTEKVIRLLKFSKYADVFMRKVNPNMLWNDKLTVLLTRIIDENNEKNFEGLRTIEDQSDEIGKFMIDPTMPKGQVIGQEIYKMKHALITYLSTLWASLDVIHSLRYGDAETMSDDRRLLQRIGMLGDDVNRQIALSEHMSEVMASGLEVLQTIYNNQLQMLNNRFTLVATWLAVLAAAVMVPNTLATVFGTAAFESVPAGLVILILILSTLLSAFSVYLVLKIKGWLPRIEGG